MDKSLWLIIGNIATLLASLIITATTNITTTLPITSSVFESPVATPSGNYEIVTIIDDNIVRYNITNYATFENAESAFLSLYKGAEVSSFNNRDRLNALGYLGYHAWYPKVVSTHVPLLVKDTSWVINITVSSKSIPETTEARLPVVESVVFQILEQIDKEKTFYYAGVSYPR